MAEQKDVAKTTNQQTRGGGGYEAATQDSVDRLTRLLQEFDRRSNGGVNSLSPEVERDIAIVTTAFESIKAALALADNPIAITCVNPAAGPATGGQDVTIEGSHFIPGATVLFGDKSATDVVVADSLDRIRLKTPAGVAGSTVTVLVNTLAGSASQPGGYRFNSV